jgi:exonuclease III
MKIVTWNCNGALRKKTKEIDALNADILIIQECEDPEQSTSDYRNWAGHYLWIGKSKNKGVGVFAKNGHKLQKQDWNGYYKIDGIEFPHPSQSWKTEDLELFLPCKINDEINLLAVWTKGANSPSFGYMGQFWKYIQIHRADLSKKNTIILGDFNSNSVWDEPDRWWSHGDVINELRRAGIESLYHFQFDEQQGKENTPTFYMHRNPEKPYHIDYIFLSSELLEKSLLQVGDIADWLKVSDHIPLINDIN